MRRVGKWLGQIAMGVVLLAPGGMSAQAQTVAGTAAAPASTTQEDMGAAQQELMRLLRVTPTMADVLASDPSLLADQQYVAKNNPELAGFLTQHPEIARNPSFWLFSELRGPQQQAYDVLQPKEGFVPPRRNGESTERMVNDIVPGVIMVVLLIALAWVIRLLVENRRWTRVFTLQSDVHGKLIERFATNQELLGYMDTEAGRRFLEASPIVTEAETRRMPNFVSRMVATLQIGFVLTLLGVGLVALRHSVGDAGTATLVFGMLALMPGIGLILSAGVLWMLGRRLNLMEAQPVSAGVDVRGRE